ncbi:unnamed protein product [Protopolystoma xenopodis]|uniref:Integrase catalytic domain-containing protein n=1 Tax=Protopolystoma xenopodis TaxID=117903 RepID=A0A3S5BR61_9PLAT|nr:unnamed protein product [Protopolystoma xenopodis]
MERLPRWRNAVPMLDMQAEIVARTFVPHWISRFGTLATITTDRYWQFESDPFAQLSKLLGPKRINMCTYHTQANGSVECFRR